MPVAVVRAAIAAALLAIATQAAPSSARAQDGDRYAVPYIAAVEQSLTRKEPPDLGLAAIREVPDPVLPAFAEWFEENAEQMPPVYLFTYAHRIFPKAPQRATRWFFAGRTRLLYDALRCRDQTVFERVAEVDAALEEIVTYAQSSPENGMEAGNWALQWDSTHPVAEHPAALLEFCLTGVEGQRRAVEQGKTKDLNLGGGGDGQTAPRIPLPDVSDPNEWVVPQSDYAAARGESFAIMQRVIAQLSLAAKDN